MPTNPASAAASWTARTYAGPHDLAAMLGLLMAARTHGDDWRYPHPGDLMWNFFMVACHLDPGRHVRLWHDAAGTLVAYALLGEDPSYECQVLPEYVDRGIEEEALGWAEELLAALRAGDAAAWGGRLMAGARLDDPAAAAFWERHGFAPGEHVEVNLLCRLDGPLPAAPLPADWQVRPVDGPEEAEARAMAQRLVWHPWSVSRISGGDYALLMALPGYHRDLDVVAVAPDGRIASYVNGWLDPRNGSGDLGPVGTLADYRQRGLARTTLLTCMAQMQARGMDRACVSTGQHNGPALALYESLGFQRVNGFREYSRA